MTGRTLLHTFVAIALMVVTLLAGTAPGSTTPVLAASTTINFDDLTPGTAISNQYDSQGVDFAKGIIGSNVYCYPVVTPAPSGQAQSGDQVAGISCANGEFPDSSIHGTLRNPTQSVSVYAGYFSDASNPGGSEQITLDAYDAGGSLLGSQTQTVMEGQGFHTLLQVDAGSASIVAFDVTSTYPYMGIDDLTFSTPAPSGCAHVSTFAELSDALNAGYTCVYVDDNAQIDLSQEATNLPPGQDYILKIPDGVTLESGRSPTVPGGLLYMSGPLAEEQPPDNVTLAMLDLGANTHITGLRLRGYDQHDANEKCCETSGVRIRGVDGVLIDNNEIYGWPQAGVNIINAPNHMNTASRIRITNNFIHNNVQCAGDGYGVVVGDEGVPAGAVGSGYALIDRNVFNYDRHDIAGDGTPGIGYIAELNLVLTSGPTCGGFYNQHFDMHGTGAGHDGGTAGEFIKIDHNTIRGAQLYGGHLGFGQKTRPAFEVRGTPSDRAIFADNAVAHGDEDAAVRVDGVSKDQLKSNGHLVINGNRYGVNTSRELAVGNFDGDRCSDIFQAVGTAWFYSPCGRGAWRFLNQSSLRLNRLGFGDFNGDGKTDVFTQEGSKWLVSYGGTTPWEALPAGSNIPMSRYHIADFDGDGKADIFRTNDHRWYLSSDGATAWEPLETSSLRLDQLRFGDFNGDGKTDVFSLANHQWSVSWGGTTKWQHLNNEISSNLGDLVFADFNGKGETDVARSHDGKWQVSWGGRTPWQPLQTRNEPSIRGMLLGDFNGDGHADALQYCCSINFAGGGLLASLARYKLSSGGRGPIDTWSLQDMP